MTLILKKGLRLRNTWRPMDPDAAAYITAVEAADGQALEERVKIAIDNFVLGCKANGIWNAIKASCILAGARTLAGALVPLVGAAPTNVGFVAGDYNRKTGLVGDGTSKYLNSNRASNAAPQAQNNIHMCVYATERNHSNSNRRWISGDAASLTLLDNNTSNGLRARVTSSTIHTVESSTSFAIGLAGVSRSLSSAFQYIYSKKTGSVASASTAITSDNVLIFVDFTLTAAQFSSNRFAFYSIGESIDLALLDARVTALVNALAVAIP